MVIVLIDFVRKPVDVMYPYHQRMLDLSLYNSILSKPFAIYCKGEIPAKVALCIEVRYSSKLYPYLSKVGRSRIPRGSHPLAGHGVGRGSKLAGFQGTAVPLRGVECPPHIPFSWNGGRK